MFSVGISLLSTYHTFSRYFTSSCLRNVKSTYPILDFMRSHGLQRRVIGLIGVSSTPT